ncbi:N-acetyltransferase [Chitinophaga silvatica]|uniref:N-acetyltransferase n=1 Tax=Chitinophaga silvatica TaxID=2282649 RepID=A0A3E1Y825_9BACT|nr:N-acetyltransferase [Chitinophaga silvatica]RFS21325.1 N-acetyltransferase [Chitinophaga silvatica]
MSLYTFAKHEELPSIKSIPGLQIKESKDVSILSQLGNITEKEVVKRVNNGNLAFIAYFHQTPVAFGWMAMGKASIGELGHQFVLPPQNRYLWNFRTISAFRGLGIYPALLQYILRSEANKTDRFWIIHAPENKSSLKGILKAGFHHVGQLYVRSDGLPGFAANSLTNEEKKLIASMDFIFSEEPTTKCWSCNSPYMKMKATTCCCKISGNICTNPISINY